MKKTRFTALLLVFIMIFSLPGCAKAEAAKSAPLEKFSDTMYEAFDTIISYTAYCESEEEFARFKELIRSEFIRYHRLFDIYYTYKDVTNLCIVNEKAAIEPVKVDRDLIDLLLFSKEKYEETNGRVNIAMGSVLKIWHNVREYNNDVDPSETILPDENELIEASKHCDINNLVIDERESTVYFVDSQMSLDVGAIAKGYATERVAEALDKAGFKDFLISAGGNVRCRGTKPDGSNWNVAVTNPGLDGVDSFLGIVSVPHGSVVTSGSYQRYFIHQGKSYHHIIDPDTLKPEDRFLSVTVITEDSGYADSLSTALFNMDLNDGQEFVKELDNVEVLWVTSDGEKIATEGFNMKE